MENNIKVKEKISLECMILKGIFIVYILCLLKIILLKSVSLIDVVTLDTLGGFKSLNLSPFKTLMDFKEIGKENFMWAFSNIAGNVCVFMPLGYFVPMLFKKLDKLPKVTIIALSLSATFEILQYILCLGSADIDDLILNTIGAICGYLIYKVIKKLITNQSKLHKISIILSIVAFIIAFYIARDEFGNILGLTEHEVVTIGDEEIPKTPSDISGTYLKEEDNSIEMYNSATSENSDSNDYLSKSTIKIDEETKIYYEHYNDEEKNKTTINYEELNKEDISELEEYSLARVWLKDENSASVVVFTNKLEGDMGTMSMATNIKDSEEISGDIDKITEEGVEIRVITTVELEDGGSVSTVANEHAKEDDKNLLVVNFKEDAIFELRIIKNNGAYVETKQSSERDMKVGDTIDLKGKKEGNTFIAQHAVINKIIEN